MTEAELNAFNDKIETELEGELNKLSTVIQYSVGDGIESYVSNSKANINTNWLTDVAMLSLVLVAILAYFIIRFYPLAGVSTMLGFILDALLTFMIFAITRVKITSFFLIPVAISLVLGLIYQIIIFNKVKSSYALLEHNEKSHIEIVENAISLNALTILGISAVMLLVGIVTIFFNLTFGLYIIVPTIVTTITSIAFSPVLFGFLAKNTGFVPGFNKFNK